MHKKIALLITTLIIPLQLHAMELAKHKNNKDVFSEQPNWIRKQILYPLIKRCVSYNDVRNILLSVGLVSKKSYEQINCPSFITNVIIAFAERYKHPTEAVAVHLGIPGSRRYQKLGKLLYSLATSNDHSGGQIDRLYELLKKGVDVNFRTEQFDTTALMKATAKSNPFLVVCLVEHGAHVNTKSNNKYTREYSILYAKKELEDSFDLLAKLMKNEQNKNTSTQKINYKLYTSPLSTTIRNALAIDAYLESKGSIIHENNKHTVAKNLNNAYLKTSSACNIHRIITDTTCRILPGQYNKSQ